MEYAQIVFQIVNYCMVGKDIQILKQIFFFEVKSLACISYAVDHVVHDGLWHQVLDGLIGDAHVGVDQVTNGFHLTLQLGVCEVFRSSISLAVHLGDRQTRWSWGGKLQHTLFRFSLRF